MTVRRTAPSYLLPIVDESGRQTQEMNAWVNEVNEGLTLIGEGSPEGVVEGVQTQMYMDTAATSTSLFRVYIKQVNSISGDKSQGWIGI